MTSSDHDLHLLTGAYAVDALDADERARFERHLAGCDACRDEVRGLRETAARLGAATAIVPPPGMRAQVLAAAARTRQLPPDSRAGAYRTIWRRFPRPVSVIAVTAAAAVIAALLVLQVTTRDQLHTAQARNQAIAAVLAAPDARVETGATSSGGTVTAVISASQREAVITAANMPSLSGGRVYQLWVMTRTGAARSAGLMPKQVEPVLASGLSAGDSLGITIEPAGGTTRPTTAPILQISAAA